MNTRSPDVAMARGREFCSHHDREPPSEGKKLTPSLETLHRPAGVTARASERPSAETPPSGSRTRDWLGRTQSDRCGVHGTTTSHPKAECALSDTSLSLPTTAVRRMTPMIGSTTNSNVTSFASAGTSRSTTIVALPNVPGALASLRSTRTCCTTFTPASVVALTVIASGVIRPAPPHRRNPKSSVWNDWRPGSMTTSRDSAPDRVRADVSTEVHPPMSGAGGRRGSGVQAINDRSSAHGRTAAHRLCDASLFFVCSHEFTSATRRGNFDDTSAPSSWSFIGFTVSRTACAISSALR